MRARLVVFLLGCGWVRPDFLARFLIGLSVPLMRWAEYPGPGHPRR